MKAIIRLISPLLLVLFVYSCMTYDSNGFWSEKDRSAVHLPMPTKYSRVLLLYEAEFFQIYTSLANFNYISSKNHKWATKYTREYVEKNINNDTIICFDPPHKGEINTETIFMLLKEKKLWIYDKRTNNFIEKIIVEEWAGGIKGQLVGSAGTTIYVGDTEIITWVHTMS